MCPVCWIRLACGNTCAARRNEEEGGKVLDELITGIGHGITHEFASMRANFFLLIFCVFVLFKKGNHTVFRCFIFVRSKIQRNKEKKKRREIQKRRDRETPARSDRIRYNSYAAL